VSARRGGRARGKSSPARRKAAAPARRKAPGPRPRKPARDTVAALVARFALEPHPEGGYYRETFRSRTVAVTRYPDGAQRSGLTTILFLLPGGTASRWHRVASDESWHFHAGAPLELYAIDGEAARLSHRVLGPSAPVLAVPAGEWQAARSTGAYTLVSCSVGPGFDFADFELLSGCDPARRPRIVEADRGLFDALT
jgi:predicted cupin superfamily sugar epimerase